MKDNPGYCIASIGCDVMNKNEVCKHCANHIDNVNKRKKELDQYRRELNK